MIEISPFATFVVNGRARMLSLASLPDELLRLVHEYLLPPPAVYCRVHDKGAALRCACRTAHVALSQVAMGMNSGENCVSLHSLTDGNYKAVRSRVSLHGHASARGGHIQPRAVCAVHDCCDPGESSESKKEMLKALRAIASQVVRGNKTLRFQFSSWSCIAHFHCVLRQAGINLSSEYSPVVTRVANGIRVSWVDIKKRRPKFYY